MILLGVIQKLKWFVSSLDFRPLVSFYTCESAMLFQICIFGNIIGAYPQTDAYYGRGSGPIWLDDLQCTGTESSLLQCPHDGIGVAAYYCDHYDDVGVQCLDVGKAIEWQYFDANSLCLEYVFLLGNFYPFGVGQGDARVPTVDDGSSSAVYLSTVFPFFGTTEIVLYVSFSCF